MTSFNEIWEILLCHEGTDTPEEVAEYRMQAFISLIGDDKKLGKADDRFVRALRKSGATITLRSMFGVKPNEPTTTATTTEKRAKLVSPFEAASRAIFG